MDITLQKKLNDLQRRVNGVGALNVYIKMSTEERYDFIAKELQKDYPGNYTVEEYYSSIDFTWKLRLKFLTNEDEMWFKLKWY